MGLPIMEKEYNWLRELTEAGVFVSFEPEMINEPVGFVVCSDGRECPEGFRDILDAASRYQGGNTDVTVFGWYGGILAMHPESSAHRIIDQRAHVDLTLDTFKSFGGKRLIIMPHAICRWPQVHKLQDVQSLENYVAFSACVKDYLKKTRSLKVGELHRYRLPNGDAINTHFKLKPWLTYCRDTGRQPFPQFQPSNAAIAA